MQNGKHGKNNMEKLNFFKNKKIFITGHTGFKGAWLSKILLDSGANLCGYALQAKENDLFSKIDISNKMKSINGDIRDFDFLKNCFLQFQPEIVIHLAAQPIVRNSYSNPRYTYETNIMGTINILECIRNSNCVKSFLNVTTDKVYENYDEEIAFKENDKLNGFDPYSNSKACSELVTSAYKNSFLNSKNIAVSTARAGNVIGGGDYSDFRIIPDCVRAGLKSEKIIIRNPNSIRPFQHVLDALFAYLLIIQKQYEDINFEGNYNVGPNKEDIINTEKLVNIFCEKWGENLKYCVQNDNGPHESSYLQLDCSKIKNVLNWKPVWNIEKAVEKVVEFEKVLDCDKEKYMGKQIKEFISCINVQKKEKWVSKMFKNEHLKSIPSVQNV